MQRPQLQFAALAVVCKRCVVTTVALVHPTLRWSPLDLVIN